MGYRKVSTGGELFMLQTLFTKVVLHTKLFISGALLFVSAHLGIPSDRPTSVPTEKITIDETSLSNNVATPNLTKTPNTQKQTVQPTPTRKSTTLPIGTTSTFSAIPTLIPTPSYNDLHCPKIIRIEDNLGNSSQTNMLSGTIKKSDTRQLTVKITANDPQDLVLSYQYSSAGLINENSTIKDWSREDTYTLNIEMANVGTNKVLFYSIDNQDRFSCAGDYTDIHGSFNYTIIP